jgi:hypothetical protein
MSALRYHLIPLLAVAIVAPSVGAGDPADTHPDLHLIPWPKALEPGTGHMPLTAKSRIVATEEQLEPLAEVLADEIAALTGLKLKVATGEARAGDIELKINAGLKADEQILMLRNREPTRTTDGAHTVTIGTRAVVEGFDYRATAEGTSTLLQLLGRTDGGARLAKVTIKDWPHADFCAAMLDVARQDHSIDDIKKVVRLCRLYKARYLQLHLTDDQGWTFPSTKYPKLGTKNYGAHGGTAPRVYKLDELKALVAYADARGVTLVPEFEVPGHSGAALRAMPEVFDAINPDSKQPVGMGCMNMSNEELYPVLDALIGEMCDVFRSSPYFHIGSDEVTSGRLSLHPGYIAFMAKHKLKDDQALADHFVRSVCAMVKKRGKKAIKWEGLSNTATKDVIVMGWESNSTTTTDLLARGYTTITVPWNLGVPWEQWNMYVCNGGRHKKGDSVLGAMLVAWEQPPRTHITNLRRLAERQERTWGPDNSVTAEGFAARFQPLDAVAGKLIGMAPEPKLEASFSSSIGTSDFCEPVFAFDGNDATFYRSGAPPKTGDHFTLALREAKQVHTIEVLTGINGKGLLTGGEVQTSADGKSFATVATLDKGAARVVLKDNRVSAVRIRAASDQTDPLVVRAINLRLMVGVSGVVRNPSAVIGDGNLAVTNGDTEFAYPIGGAAFPVINRGHVLKLNNGGTAFTFGGPISGTGTAELFAGGPNGALVLAGGDANTMKGTWEVKSGHVVLAKPPGTDAVSGTIIVAGDGAALVLGASDQIHDDATVELRASKPAGTFLRLNGQHETFAKLTLGAGGRVLTDGASSGALTVRELVVEGRAQPRGVYTASSGWLIGNGYVVVGDVKRLDAKGAVTDPEKTFGAGNIAVLKGAATFELPDGECTVAVVTGAYPLTLAAGGKTARFGGFVTGNGGLRIEASREGPLELTGAHGNVYSGPTTLARGTLKLNKPANTVAVPGALVLGGDAAENDGAAVVLGADGQIAPAAVVTLRGAKPSALDLNGHGAAFAKLVLSRAAVVRTGTNGSLRVKQLFVDGKRLKDGTYRGPHPWLEGTGTVVVDSRTDVKGVIGAPERSIGPGNIGNLTGDTTIGYPSSGGDYDVVTNGFTLKLDSGDGNAFAYSGGISGTGTVEFYMGPSRTGYRDAPMVLNGTKPNTLTGKFYVKKGRVQLEKPEGVDAISGDVIVGGQGFNDCLFWKNSHQIRDTAGITLLDAGNSGAAYLHLNGCAEAVASLTMTAKNRVVTDAADGTSGALTVKALTIGGVAEPAGTYTAENAKWIEGKGKVIVRP